MIADFVFFCSILILLRYTQDDKLDQKIILCVLLTLISCCFTLTLNPVMAEITYVMNVRVKKKPQVHESVDVKSYAQAYDVLSCSYSLNNTIGPICAGSIKNATDWSTISWSLGLIGGLTALFVTLWSGSPSRRSWHQTDRCSYLLSVVITPLCPSLLAGCFFSTGATRGPTKNTWACSNSSRDEPSIF